MKMGLFGKYIIAHSNGEPIDPKAKYFVLRYDSGEHVKAVRDALIAYTYDSGNPQLRIDLIADFAASDKQPTEDAK